MELDTLFRDVASIISEKCINPNTSRPYTISMIERALKDAHFSVDLKHSAKAQALEVSGFQHESRQLVLTKTAMAWFTCAKPCVEHIFW